MVNDTSLLSSKYDIENDPPKEIVNAFRKAMLDQYESNLPLHAYADELALFNCVKTGDVDKLDDYLKQLTHHRANTGHMSSDPILQSQFMVVSGITLATRYALAGGLSEAEAFHLSDAYLQKLNKVLSEKDAIHLFLIAIHDFTRRVKKAKSHGNYSYPVARCLKYIANHLYQQITLSDLAKECDVAPQYLSSLFHKEFGITLMKYIRAEKLKVAATMLEQSDLSICRITNIFEFPSQSAFTAQFKYLYGMTPTEYRAQKYQEHADM